MLRCVKCGCSRLNSEKVGCVLCGGSPSLRTERCHINEDTKTILLAHAEELKTFDVTLEVEEHKTLQKGVGPWLEAAAFVLAAADSLDHGVLRKLVVFLRDKKIAEDQIRRLRLDEPEKILAYYREDKSGPPETRQKHTTGRKPLRTKRKPAPKSKSRNRKAKRRRK